MAVAAAFLSNTLFNFAIGILLARFLGPEAYGRFAVAFAAAVIVQTLAFDWARLAAARFYSERVRGEDPALRATLEASLAALVLALAVGTLLVLLPGITLPIAPDFAALAVAVAVANGLFDYHSALVRARFLDGVYARLVLGKNVLALLLTVGGAYWFGSAQVALLGVALSLVGAVLGVRRPLADPAAAWGLAQRRRAGRLFRYALPVVLANVCYQSIPFADRLIIARLHGLAESGQFSFAYEIGVRVVAAIGSMLDVILFQIAVRADEIGGAHEGRRQAGRNVGLVFAVLLPACTGCWLVLPSFEALAVPPEFRGAFARYFGQLLPGLFCYGLVFFALQPLFQLDRRTGPLTLVAAGAAIANLLLLAALPIAADTGWFAVAQAAAFALAAAALVFGAAATRPAWPRARDLGLAVAGTALMAAAVSRIGGPEPGAALLLLQAGAGALIYLAFAALCDLCGLRTLIRNRYS